MPTITLNRKEFEKYVGKKLPLDQLKDRISMLGTDLEEVTDSEIHVEIFPNRPDLLSMQGFSRAFSSFISHKPGLKKYGVNDSKEHVIVEKSVAKVRPYTACALVKNLKFTDEKIKEVIDIQEKLHVTFGRNRKKCAIGIYPLQHIKLPITFKAEKPEDIVFRPLEFPKAINALQILEQHPAGKDYGHLLEGEKVFPVFRDANGEVLSVPPIINSHKTGRVDEHTTEVFIETSGHDFEVQKQCLNMLVAAFEELGGTVYSMQLTYPDQKVVTPNLNPTKMKFNLAYINKLLGLSLKENEAKKLLERMGFGYEKGTVLIPAYRADIIHQADLAEDIAIAYGYEHFEPIIPAVATVAQEDPFEAFKDKLATLLVGLGLLETSTYHLSNKTVQNENMNASKKLITLTNSISSDYDSLRAWMLPSLMEVLASNKHHEYPQKIFEMGATFVKDATAENGIAEPHVLSVALASEDTDYTEIRQVLDYIFRSIDMPYEVKETTHDSFIAGRVAKVMVAGKEVALLGEVHPQVLENWELTVPVTALELDCSTLYELIQKKK